MQCIHKDPLARSFIAPKLGFQLGKPELNLFIRSTRREDARERDEITAAKKSHSGFVPKIGNSKLKSETYIIRDELRWIDVVGHSYISEH